MGGDIPREKRAAGAMGVRRLLRDDGDMEFIESLAAQLLTTLQVVVTGSPMLGLAALVLALLLYSGLAARVLEFFDGRTRSFDQVRHLVSSRLRAVSTRWSAPRRRRSPAHVDPTAPHFA